MGIFDVFKLDREVVVHDYEAGLMYEKGQFKKLLDKGLYKVPKEGFEKEIVVVDKRMQNLTITGQEILTKDKLNLRLNVLVKYRIIDPVKAIHEVENYYTSVYQDVQMSIRGVVGSKYLDELLSIRNIFDDEIKEEIKIKCEKYGVEIESIELKDTILPGNLKAILMKEIEAKKDSEIALIKARSEVAQTRALINAANIVKDHPEILKLRMMESLGKLSEAGNSFVIPLPSDIFEKFKEK